MDESAAIYERTRALAWAGEHAHRLTAGFAISTQTPSWITPHVKVLGDAGGLAGLVEWLHAEREDRPDREREGWRYWAATTDDGITVQLAESGHPVESTCTCQCRQG